MEYRLITGPIRPVTRLLRIRTIVSKPPSHTATKTRCRPRLVVAASWPAVPALCPCRAIGTSPMAANTVTKASAAWLRTAKHRTVVTAATRVVANHAWPGAIVVRKVPSSSPNRLPEDTGSW